ncbi:centrosomal protein 43-like isoform X3 [Ruditapes philippinarum]|uniref:centrosomal protein 43-like isoform X3 n=1 Tax=Ruditapes philippinarum TaxID=129788 RepID=UPI00295C31C6|nr:centrosomal protein 43-like isoform X3 [Ruditapes philippinarum]
MSADEDTELRDLVAQTLETNGVLGKIRAQLRASVFLALEEQESIQNKTPFQNPDLNKFVTTKEGQAVVGLVREFLDFFNLEFTQAVFEPESGCNTTYEGRNTLAKQLNISENTGGPKVPLLAEILKRPQGEKTSVGRPIGIEGKSGETDAHTTIPQELTPKQLADARKKFEYYDRDKNNEIDKEELRDLFTDMFPNFNRNMLDRYVNDEFRAADRDISNKSYFSITSKGISFSEFLSMYKRLFLQCRSVVSGDVSDILSPASNKSLSSHISKASNSERSERSLVDSRNQRNLENGPKQLIQDNNNTDTEEDFFDDPVPTSPSTGFKAYGSKGDSPSEGKRGGNGRPSQIPVFSALRSEDKSDKSESNGIGGQKTGSQGRGQSGGMSSLQGLPSLTGDRGTSGRKSPQGEPSENLRAMDKRMSDLGLDGDGQDYSYEDDFVSEGHSMSQKSPRTRSEAQNGSIAEEIEEDLDDLSIEGDDLLRSEKSAFDDMTTDRTISQHETGYDYIEDLQD